MKIILSFKKEDIFPTMWLFTFRKGYFSFFVSAVLVNPRRDNVTLYVFVFPASNDGNDGDSVQQPHLSKWLWAHWQPPPAALHARVGTPAVFGCALGPDVSLLSVDQERGEGESVSLEYKRSYFVKAFLNGTISHHYPKRYLG